MELVIFFNKEFIIIIMANAIEDNGDLIKNKGMGNYKCHQKIYTKDNGNKGKRQDKESIFLRMEIYIKEILLMVCEMDLDSIIGLIKVFIRGIGKMIK